MKIAFQGEWGAFGELAAQQHFGDAAEYVPQLQFDDVFDAVAQGRCNFGIVPIENSLAGSIHHNYDLLLAHDLHIVAEVPLQIGHYLIANKGVHKKDIRTIYSHPQALAQCKNYIAQLPGVAAVPFSNTAGAVREVREKGLRNAAAIASMQAAIDFDMQVIAQRIEDNEWNTTRFLVLAKKAIHPKQGSGPIKTSIVFSAKNIPGVLFKCLSVFALRDIDLYKIESRPVHGKGFQYLFYLDFHGDIRDEASRNAINHLQEVTTFYRMLGCYPVGKLVKPQFRKRAIKHQAEKR